MEVTNRIQQKAREFSDMLGSKAKIAKEKTQEKIKDTTAKTKQKPS